MIDPQLWLPLGATEGDDVHELKASRMEDHSHALSLPADLGSLDLDNSRPEYPSNPR